jgi:hypothetical protein
VTRFRGTLDAFFFGMAVATQTAEEHVLETFARHDANTLSTTLLFEQSRPFAHADIARALAQLEYRERALLRYTWDGTDWVTLTLRGLAMRDGAQPAPRLERRKQPKRLMPEIVFEHPHAFRANGRDYNVYVLGSARGDGTWAGWIEFVPQDGSHRLRTGQETSQPSRDTLAYWASGLEDLYFDGALARASE